MATKAGGDECWCSAGCFLIFEHMSGGAHRCTLLYMYTWWAEVEVGCVLLTLSTLLFEVGSLTVAHQELTISACLASKPLRSTCLSPPGLELQMPKAVSGSQRLGIWTSVLILARQTLPTEPPPQSLTFTILFSPGLQPAEWRHPHSKQRNRLSSSVTLLRKSPPRHTQRKVCLRGDSKPNQSDTHN